MQNSRLRASHNSRTIGGSGLFANVSVSTDEKVFDLRITHNKTRTSIQLDQAVFSEGADEFNDVLNHSCDPNLYVDFDRRCLRARWEVKPGNELFMNYLTTEWELIAPFKCICGSDYCFGSIRGFRYLDADDRERLSQMMTPYLIAEHLTNRIVTL